MKERTQDVLTIFDEEPNEVLVHHLVTYLSVESLLKERENMFEVARLK